MSDPASKRRARGEGSVGRFGDGWRARLTLPDGTRRAVYGKTKQEAARKLREAQRAVEDGVLNPTSRHTLGSYLAEWLAVVRITKRPSTHAFYDKYVRVHIVPALGSIRLVRLEPRQIDAMYSDKLASRLSPTTVLHIHRTLHRALRMALRKRYIVRNVADEVEPPAKAHFEGRALTPDEAIRLLEACDGQRLGPMVVLALTAGLRRGEVAGLRWSDVDLDGGLVFIRQSLGEVRGQGMVAGGPKTRRSRRRVPLIPSAIKSLVAVQRRQDEERRAAGPLWRETDLVFTTSIGGPINPSNMNGRFFKPLRERLGLPDVRFHDLRHSAASLLFALGIEPKLIQEILGHSTIAITLDTYTHTVPAQHRAAMESLGGLLEGRIPRSRASQDANEAEKDQ